MSGNNGININLDPIALLEWGRVQGAQQQELQSRLMLLQQLYVAQQAGYTIPPIVQAHALGATGGLQINLPPMQDAAVPQNLVAALPSGAAPMRSAAPVAVAPAPPVAVASEVDDAEPVERSGSAVAALRYLLGTGVVMLLIAMVLGLNPLKWLPRLEFGVGKASQSVPSVSPVSSPSSAPSPAVLQGGVGISGRVEEYIKTPAVEP